MISGMNHGNFLGPESAIDGKVCLISGHNLRVRIKLGENDKRGIPCVHVRILDHQFLRAFKVFGPRSKEMDGSCAHKGEECMGWARIASQIPTRFTDDDFAGVKRPANFGQDRHAPVMPLVRGIQPTDQRASVNESPDLQSPPWSKGLMDRETSPGMVPQGWRNPHCPRVPSSVLVGQFLSNLPFSRQRASEVFHSWFP